MPGTFSVFQDAYQTLLERKGQGGGLTGQAAYRQLVADVSAGKVVSNELLPIVAELMRERAAPKLEVAKETSQGWQGRLANQRTGWTKIASESGLERGQRNYSRFFTQWMNENQWIPQKFGEIWEELSEQFVIAGGFPGLLKEALGGGENIISEWLGPEKMAQFIEDFESLSSAAKTAAKFLGFLQEPDEDGSDKTVWQSGVERLVAGIRIPYAIMEGEFAEANENRKILFEGGWDAYRRRMPHLRAAEALKDKYLGLIDPERDDEGNAVPWMNYTGRQPVYYPRGAELLLQEGQSGASGSSPTLVIESLTVTANSSDPEDLADRIIERVEDSYRRAMMGISR